MNDAAELPDSATSSPALVTPPARPHRWFTVSLAVLLALTIVARFFAIEADAPYAIISHSGTFLTDEGWYTKSAQLHTRFGVWCNAEDFCWYSHSFLATLLQRAAFGILGTGLATARLLSILGSVIALASLYGIARTTQPRVMALVTCLLVSLTLHNLAYSRLALLEPVGVGFSLAALYFWVRFPRSIVAAGGAIALAGAAFLVKFAFAYSLIAAGLLVLGDAVACFHRGARGRAAAYACVAVIGCLAVYSVHTGVVNWSAGDGETFAAFHIAGRVEMAQSLRIILYELKSLYTVMYKTGATTLTCSLVGGALFLLIKQRLTVRTFRRRWSRATLALLLWGVGGVTLFGLFRGQPPRYYYFALFPLVYATVMVTGEVVGKRHWRLACLFLLFLHVTVQLPGYERWLRRDDLHTGANSARQIVARIHAHNTTGEPVVLLGGIASYVTLFDDRIRSIEFNPWEGLTARLRRWRPRYMIVEPSRLPQFEEFSPGVIAKMELLESYRIMENYYTGEDFGLYVVAYSE